MPIEPVTHLEKAIARTVEPVTHLEKVIEQYGGGGGSALPSVTSADNGKFLRVVSGAWAAQAVPSAESNSFGGGA